ncbi:triacylglycerol lipase 3 [Coprinopsis sp. MPI-PUGE-AT-0042]|nr:triacylglycerol lipase 3 [Coprinopsis sp. MPI-PUGE-AT-0042]
MIMLPQFLTVLSLSLSALAAEVRIKDTKLVGRKVPALDVEFLVESSWLTQCSLDLGIPFAEAPVGQRRFRTPELKKDLQVPSFNATQWGRSCLQVVGFNGVPEDQQSEDCLNINIIRPAGVKPGTKLPIFAYIYGGGFIHGGASEYDGSQIVARSVERGTPIIYAAFNHRLGPFGYPHGLEAQKEGNLNLAQKDILTALEWLQLNVDKFGGDKHKVTIGGQSSGAMSIHDLYFVKGIEGLIRGTIQQSGSAGTIPIWNATERETLWPRFVSNIPSCASLASSERTFACLRNASEAEVKASYNHLTDNTFLQEWWGPTLDQRPGSLFPDFPSRLYERGQFARIPFIAGADLDEGTGHAGHARDPSFTEADLKASITAQYLSTTNNATGLEKLADGILKLYPDVPALGSPYRTGNELFGLRSIYKRTSAIGALYALLSCRRRARAILMMWIVEGDITFAFPLRHWMQTAAKYGVKQYGYLFSHAKAGTFENDPAYGIHHGAEIPYIFGNTADASPSGQELKAHMMDYWISFIVNLDPNDGKGSKRPKWSQYTKSNQVLIQLEGGNTTTIKDDFRKEQIEFFISNVAVLRR